MVDYETQCEAWSDSLAWLRWDHEIVYKGGRHAFSWGIKIIFRSLFWNWLQGKRRTTTKTWTIQDQRIRNSGIQCPSVEKRKKRNTQHTHQTRGQSPCLRAFRFSRWMYDQVHFTTKETVLARNYTWSSYFSIQCIQEDKRDRSKPMGAWFKGVKGPSPCRRTRL